MLIGNEIPMVGHPFKKRGMAQFPVEPHKCGRRLRRSLCCGKLDLSNDHGINAIINMLIAQMFSSVV